MRHDQPSPGLPFVIPFALPANWEPGEALTVFELVDDLRSAIWAHYQLHLLKHVPQDGRPNIEDYFNTTIDSTAAIDIAIPAGWAPKQALVVFHLLDRLRRNIWLIYQADIQFMLRRRRRAHHVPRIEIADDELPF